MGKGSHAKEDLIVLAERWQRERKTGAASDRWARIAVLDFVFVGSNWLRFLGRFEERAEDQPYQQFLGEFLSFLKDERGFAEATISGVSDH